MEPSWQDTRLGSKARAALWLVSVVGEGRVFTKAQVRAAFPEAQIDRRIRELRDHGWEIHTSRDDPSLRQDEQRYVKRGAEVWIPGQKTLRKAKTSLTAAQRIKVMQADGFLCRSCGISAGESYGDGGPDAQLDIARRNVRNLDGIEQTELVTECNRCRTGGAHREVDLAEFIGRVQGLGPLEQDVFLGWMDAGQRELGELEKLWATYRSFPESSRDAVRDATRGLGN
ncbi:hypothetical protein DSC45_06890 [Streptomyces sp. YIM 130001]|uniref:heterodisulfide reductase-related iron-sulfur binding cluster n=1 Tax=Streptomyces sp. YIM 130001 TaxID=2259644 RepID=UPI000E657FE0|nr:heterodisulfide reductase-related iron-sulfur binding cluster [Streptomyces sp. YIM 130001]RII19720.1 hypothetical protein DSC45_06890 [Streptomyces sp. YIM 130001]